MKKSVILRKDEDIVHIDGHVYDNEIYISMEKDDRVFDLLTLTKEYEFVDLVWTKLMLQEDLEGDNIHISCDEETLKTFIVSMFCVFNKTVTQKVSSKKSKLTVELPD